MANIINKVNNTVSAVANTAVSAYNTAGNAVLLTLSKMWIGYGLVHPAKTDPNATLIPVPDILKKKVDGTTPVIESEAQILDRFDYERLFSLQIGDYFMPLSQNFSLRAKKRLNVSSLVAGIDVIQQTRKEAKTIDVKLRMTLRPDGVHDNLKIVDIDNKIQRLSWFLNELYEDDTVFFVANDMINNTFGVTYCFMTDYRFTPRQGMHTYDFEFSLMSVAYGDNVLTFDLRQVNADVENNGQING